MWHIDQEAQVHVIVEEQLIRGCRRRAAAHAVRNELPRAVEELQSSWELNHANTVEAGSDIAWVHLLAGNPHSALAMLALVTRGRRRLTRRVRDLIAACVALDGALWTRALALGLARGSVVDRIRVAATVMRIRLGRHVNGLCEEL
jgi:hypothetical protein